MATDPIIRAERLTKRFTVRRRAGRVRRSSEEIVAVDGVDFSIAPGETVGYVGPNGAGKSTTIKMLIGILTPTEGRVDVDGIDPSRDRTAVAGRLGVVFGQRSQLWWDLPLADSFSLLRHVYRRPSDRHDAVLHDLTDRLDLGPLLGTPVRQLSLGQRMRGELAAALLHEPRIVLLDEPTIGLDITSKEAVRTFLTERNREDGTTILLTTHDLDDVERLCSRLLVIDHGRIVEDTTVPELKDREGTGRILVVDLYRPTDELEIDGVEVVRTEGARQWLRFDREQHTASSVLAAVTATHPVRDISLVEPDIEDVIARLYDGR